MKLYNILCCLWHLKFSFLFPFHSIFLAASVIRMFFHTLTEATFHKGLKIYLSKSTSNPEGVAEPQNLYDALQQAIDDEGRTLPNDIETLFGSWEMNAGYPIVYVERSYNDRRIRFTQVGRIEFSTTINSIICLLFYFLESLHRFNIRIQ